MDGSSGRLSSTGRAETRRLYSANKSLYLVNSEWRFLCGAAIFFWGSMILPTREVVASIEAARWSPDPETTATLDFIVVSLTAPDADGICELQRIYERCAYEAERDEAVGAIGFRLAAARRRHVYVWFMADCPDDGWCSFHLVLSDRPITREDVRRKAKRRYSLNLLKERSEWIGYEKAAAPEGSGSDF